MPQGRKRDELPTDLMTDYMEKISGKGSKKTDEETSVEALRSLITYW